MTGIAQRLARQYPDTNKDRTVVVTRMRDDMVGDVRLMLYLLLGAVSVVLLIACANTATLLLGKATARTREVAVRIALGAGHRRIVRQLITESVLLALIAGAAGLLLAYAGSKALVALAPANLPRLAETAVDRSLLFHAYQPAVRSGPCDLCIQGRPKRCAEAGSNAVGDGRGYGAHA
jgi:ABC-type antimicrobial peptide transport system permease subunit